MIDINQRIGIITGKFKADMAKANTKTDEQFGEILIAGVELLGQLLVDVNRIAYAAERAADAAERAERR